MGVTYDSGALIAADKGERRMWARHRALLVRRVIPTVPAPVVAQSWRGTSRQVLLARLLSGCDVETLDDGRARSAGTLAARAATSDIVDACVVEGALRRHDLVVSSDEDDLRAIASAVGDRIEIDRPLLVRRGAWPSGLVLAYADRRGGSMVAPVACDRQVGLLLGGVAG
jgi:hypothetical protein